MAAPFVTRAEVRQLGPRNLAMEPQMHATVLQDGGVRGSMPSRKEPSIYRPRTTKSDIANPLPSSRRINGQSVFTIQAACSSVIVGCCLSIVLVLLFHSRPVLPLDVGHAV